MQGNPTMLVLTPALRFKFSTIKILIILSHSYIFIVKPIRKNRINKAFYLIKLNKTSSSIII